MANNIHNRVQQCKPESPLPKLFGIGVTIHPCISYWRKGRLSVTVTGSYPWARALTRLLADKGWTSSQLAEKADVPTSRISELKKTDRPYMPFVQKLADALGVELWEFFVSDEQSRVLRQIKSAQQHAVNEDALLDRAMQKMRGVLAEARAELASEAARPITKPVPVEPAAKRKKHA